MSADNKPTTNRRKSTTNKGAAFGLDDKAMKRLAGFYDVLIQMDLAIQQRKKLEEKYGKDLRLVTAPPAESD